MQQPEPAELNSLPAARIGVLRDLVGADEVVRWCAQLLRARVAFDDPDRPSLAWLGGANAVYELSRGALVERGVDYWPRVWAARGLLHVWEPALATTVAVPALLAALSDDAWRVREMAAKVVRRWDIGEAGDGVAVLVHDVVPRVRRAAVRALGNVGEFEHASVLRLAVDDVDGSVGFAARQALRELGLRLDRNLDD